MKLSRTGIVILGSCLMILITGCSSLLAKPTPTPTPEWQIGQPRAGQPAFPAFGQYWIIDNGCGFDPAKVKIADAMFEQLRTEKIAEVAIVCQTGILDKGGTNDEKIWLRDWARWAKMGDVEDDRAVVWLIRPDVEPGALRVTVEISRWLYWYTAIAYADSLKEASDYANVGDYDGALVSLARNVDEELRQLWATHAPAPTP